VVGSVVPEAGAGVSAYATMVAAFAAPAHRRQKEHEVGSGRGEGKRSGEEVIDSVVGEAGT
jgi:hypothetical protein